MPPSSAGCALPAMTSWIGRSGCSSRRLSRSGSRSISVSRLYDGTRRAKPIVSTSGSSAVVDPAELGLGGAALRARAREPLAGVDDQALAQRRAWSPRCRRRGPCRRPAQNASVSSESGSAPWRGGQLDDLAGDPGRGVHAVGDRADRHLGLVEGRPQAVEHAAADVAVQLGDAVGALREPEAHHRHVEDGGVAALVVLGAERAGSARRDAGGRAGRRRSTARPASRGKRSMPAGTGVWVVKTVEARPTSSAVSKSSPGPPSATVSSRIRSRPRKPAWPSLVWKTSGAGCAGDPRVGAQRPDAADAEQQLLAQPVLAVAAVQPVGDVAVVVGVALDVGVEQQQRHPADAGDPDPGQQVGPAGQRDRDDRALAVVLAQQRDRQPVGVEDRVGLLLPALAGERLLEVAVPVEQADADDRDAEVAGGLEVVAGEDAEAAGVLRQHGGDAELRGEVGDRARGVVGRPGAGTSGRRSGSRSRSAGAAEAREEALVARRARPSRLRPTAPSRRTGSWPTAPRPRGRRTRRRPASRGARTTAGCRPGRPARRAPRAGQDGR